MGKNCHNCGYGLLDPNDDTVPATTPSPWNDTDVECVGLTSCDRCGRMHSTPPDDDRVRCTQYGACEECDECEETQ